MEALYIKLLSKQNQFFLIGLLCVFIYIGTSSFDYVMDDAIVTHQNEYVKKGFSGLVDIFSNPYLKGFNGEADQTYRPIVLASFAIEQELLGLNSSTSHLINLILYIICCYYILLFLNLLIKDKNSLLPLFITLLFVAHPIHTEVIANVKSRDEILCALGGFMGLYYAFRLIHEEYLKKHFILMIIGLLISLFSKEIGLAYVVLVPFTIWFFDGSIARFKKEFILAPIVLIALFFTIRLNMLETNAQLDDLSVLNNALVGIDSQMDKITTALFIQLKGLILQVFPHQLSWDYSYNQIPEVKTFSIQGILTWIALVGVIIIGFIGVKGKKIWGWVIVFYIATVFLTSNLFVLFGATMGERFFFSPSFAIVFIVGLITREIIIKKNISNKISFSLSVLLVTVFSFNAYNQKMIWESTKTIALAGISSAPQSTRTWETYASYYRELAEKSDNQKDFNQNITKAIKGYQKSTEILKSNFSALYNLGVSYTMVQKTDSALYAYQTCIQVNPKYENALNNIAVIYINARNIEPAKETVNKLLELNPVHVDGLINKGLIYHIEGDLSSAKTYYLKALKISPNHSVALKNIALIK